MALIQCRFFSETLGLSTSMTVILPQETTNQIGMKGAKMKALHPTLYLLHGLSDDDSIWLRRTSIERYVAPLGLAVVMPQVHRSFYADMQYGYKYWTFLSEELPKVCRSFFPLSDKREDNFVAGLSMGGYGAFKWALSKPEQFTAAAGLSTANLIYKDENSPLNNDLFLAFGEEAAGTENDLFYLIEKCQQMDGPKPKIYQCCGTEDFLYERNLQLKEAFEKSSFDYTYEEEPGEHEWGYWDKKIQDVLSWLPLGNK